MDYWSKNPDEFWFELSKLKNSSGEFLFKNISEFSLDMLCFPISNATSERVWSKLRLEKSYLRTNLSFDSIRVILLSCECAKNFGGILKFEPDKDMLMRYATKHKQPKISRYRFENSDSYIGLNINTEYLNESVESEELFVKKIKKDSKLNFRCLEENLDLGNDFTSCKEITEPEENCDVTKKHFFADFKLKS